MVSLDEHQGSVSAFHFIKGIQDRNCKIDNEEQCADDTVASAEPVVRRAYLDDL